MPDYLNSSSCCHRLKNAVSAYAAQLETSAMSSSSFGDTEQPLPHIRRTIIYFNSLVLSKLLVHFENMEQIDMLTLTQQVSPVAWTNINLNGTYSFNFGQDILDMDELIRPITEEEVLIEN